MERYRHCPSCLEDTMASSKAIHRRKKSLWNWAPMRAFAKIRQQQFYCVFSIFVQTIDGLPSYMDGLRLVVQLERKSKHWQTMPCRVFQHVVEFDETLHIETTIFGREKNMQDHTMKFLPKEYILSVVAIDAEEHFLFNRHRIDLSLLLPASIEGFWEPDKPMSSTASFKLGGKAERAILVATFDFEVLNDDLRWSNGNASARFGGSALQRVSRAVKSLPSSPTPSPFVRRANHHFTSPCSSDPDSADSTCIGRFDLDSSAKETEEWSVYDYSSSDEERFQALKNDPLSLDAFMETDVVTFSSPKKVKAELGSLDDFSKQIHLTNVECMEKVEVPLVCGPELDTLCHEIDVRTLLNSHEAESDDNGTSGGSKEIGKLEVVERESHVGEVAADKFCINIQVVNSYPTSCAPIAEVNGKANSGVMVGEEHFIGNVSLSPSCMKSKSLDSSVEGFSPDDFELFSEASEKHFLVERVQSFSLEEIDCTPGQSDNAVCVGVQTHSNVAVQLEHSREDESHENILESLLDASAEGFYLSPSSTRNEYADTLQFSVEDDILLEASVVEDFFDFLEREEESNFTGSSSPEVGALDASDKQMIFPEKCRPSSTVEEEYIFPTCVKPGKLCPSTNIPWEGQSTFGEPVSPCSRDDSFEEIEAELSLFSFMEAAELEMRKAAQNLRSKERAKMLEDAETKALMKEWGLSDKVFEGLAQNLLPCPTSEVPHVSDSPSVISLTDGGYLKAMNGHSCGTLIMQVSKPVVIPARASLHAIDILSSMASQGLEDLTLQALAKMPLEDLAGSSIEHSFRDAGSDGFYLPSWQGHFPGLILKEQLADSSLSATNCTGHRPSKVQTQAEKVVSFGDFVHVALHTIEPLALEGFKVQYGLSKEAPFNEFLKGSAMPINMNNSIPEDDIQEKSLVHDGRLAGLPEQSSLLDVAISLDKWLQLFERVDKAEDKLLVAREGLQKEESSKVEEIPGWPSWTHGSNSFTVAMRLQLRDPQRYFEPVGASMMALLQVERFKEASVPLEEGSELFTSNGGMGELLERHSEVQLRFTGVHISGVQQSDLCGLKSWGTKQQHQSGYRWVMANLKTSRLRHAMSQASISLETDSKHVKREILWSISACAPTTGRTRREPEEFCPCIRNPDLTFEADDSL